jgi:superfamily II DNA or RNA helicase
MTYGISDFLPFYPSIQDDDFNVGIKSKHEFRDPGIEKTESVPTKKGDLFAHQVLVSRLLSSHTPYDGILLMHEMGTGKTCSASAIIQQVRSENNGIDKFIYIAKNKSLLKNFDDEFRGKCTVDDYKFTKNLADLHIHRLTYDGFRKEYEKKQLKNCVVIIDEIHNIKGQSKSYTESNMYNKYYSILQGAVNTKVILLSGTPITDKPNEIASVMNLILPPDEQLPTGINFDAKFIKDADELSDVEIINKKLLIDAFAGRISYIKSMESVVKKVFVGQKKDTFKHFLLDSSRMSEEQTIGYKKAIEQDEEGGSPAFSNSLQASDIVVDDEYGVTLKKLFLKGTTSDEKLKYLEKYSSKYAASIRTIIDARKDGKSVFVFNKHVDGGGLKMFAGLLTQFGFNEVTKDKINSLENPAKRFVLLTGSGGVDTSKIGKISGRSQKGWGSDLGIAVKRFNKEDNINGEMIGVVLASEAISEGYSFNNVQVIDIHSPWFNFAKTSQVVARGIRVGSHDLLIKQRAKNGDNSDINVEIHLRISVPYGDSGTKYPSGIDTHTYKIAEQKDIVVKKIERIIKENAIDSYLARKRNKRDKSFNGTRECDYTKCSYKSFPGSNVNDSTRVDYSTSELYYSNDDEEVIVSITDMFKNRSSLRLFDIVKLYNTKKGRVVVKALIKIINDDIPIQTSTNGICFLREQNNVFYLVNTYSNTSTILDMYYMQNNHVDVEYVAPDDPVVGVIEISDVTSIQTLNYEMRSMSDVEKEQVLEKNIPDGNKMVLEKYKGLWGEIDGTTYSWFPMTKKGVGRVLDSDTNNWKDADAADEQKIRGYNDKLKAEISEKAMKIFGKDAYYYGLFDYSDSHAITSKIRTFSIMKLIDSKTTENKDAKVDNRKIPNGLNCMSFTGPKKQEFTEIFEKLKQETDDLGQNTKTLASKCVWIEEKMKTLGLLTRFVKL